MAGSPRAGSRARVPARRLSDLERRRGRLPASGRVPFTFPARLDEEPDFGRLEFLAGFVLSGSDPRFGGLSGLWVAPDGGRLIALSDRGTLWLAEPEHAADGRLVGFAAWQAIEPGTAPGDPPESDAELLAVAGDDLVIAYEGAHRLRRVPLAAPSSPAAALPTPPQLSEPHNVGIEALVGLEGGALLAIAEGVRTPSGDLAAWLIEGDRVALAEPTCRPPDLRRPAPIGWTIRSMSSSAACRLAASSRAWSCWMRRMSGPAPGWSAANSAS